MNHKSTTPYPQNQPTFAGVHPNDHNIEFIGCRNTMTVYWMRMGNTHEFKFLDHKIYTKLETLFLSDQDAVKILTKHYDSDAHNLRRLVEIYTCYMYGDHDSNPDVIEGELQTCENFRQEKDCLSLSFKNKFIDIDGVHLTRRDLNILDDIVEGLPDKMIAHKMGLHIGTYDFHKRNLFKKLKVDSKVALAVKTLKNNVPCS